jgi:hypothetical protein
MLSEHAIRIYEYDYLVMPNAVLVIGAMLYFYLSSLCNARVRAWGERHPTRFWLALGLHNMMALVLTAAFVLVTILAPVEFMMAPATMALLLIVALEVILLWRLPRRLMARWGYETGGRMEIRNGVPLRPSR